MKRLIQLLYHSLTHGVEPFLKIHFNIVDPPTSWSSQWSLTFWLSHQYHYHSFLNIWKSVNINKFNFSCLRLAIEMRRQLIITEGTLQFDFIYASYKHANSEVFSFSRLSLYLAPCHDEVWPNGGKASRT
jgi:hypothetical protein